MRSRQRESNWESIRTPERSLLAGAEEAIASSLTGGRPFFLYDLDLFVESVDRFCRQAAAPGAHRTRVFFPMFANPNVEILRTLTARVTSCGILVNSPEEAEVLESEGIGDRSRRVFTGGVVDSDDLSVVARACETVHCSSLGNLETLIQLVGQQPGENTRVGLRVDLRGDALKGLTRAECEEAFSLAKSSGVRISSLHSYPGTEIDSLEELVLHARLFLEFASQYSVDVVNLGGGFGYDYGNSRSAFDVEEFFRRFAGEVRALDEARRLGSSLEFAWEPGRLLGASAGAYICQVIETRKREPGFVDLYVDGTFAHLPAPKIRNRQHRVLVVAPDGGLRETGVCWARICGATTLSTDTLLPGHVLMPEARRGDRIVVLDVGCYGRSGSYNFLCRRLPAEIGFERGALRVLRAAQTTADVFGLDDQSTLASKRPWRAKAV